jgi:hypothetical protein
MPVYLGMTKTIAALLLATTSIAAADTKPATKPADVKPEPTDAKLAQLVGRWEGKSTFTLRGKTTTWTVTSSCERATVGPAIVCMMVGVSGAMRLEESWMFGYDKASDSYHLFMTNNWGEAYDHAAKWSDAKQVSFVHTGTRDGKPLREEYKLTFKGDELVYKGVLSVDGKPVGEGTTISKRLP